MQVSRRPGQSVDRPAQPADVKSNPTFMKCVAAVIKRIRKMSNARQALPRKPGLTFLKCV